ncbi:MAG: PepSY domain-containing protein, partial [Planctomycetes bacterium]|nr:PepSY domain-containing protein [Planctomycetota bacterium]
MSAPKTNRKLHRIGALISALPLLVILISGLLLQLKKQVDWIQPPTQRGSIDTPGLDFERILELTRAVPEAQVESWDDIDRLDVRPTSGV